VEAETAVAAAQKAVADLDARREDDEPVLSKDEVAAAKKRAQELSDRVLADEKAAFDRAAAAAAKGREEGTLEGLGRARSALEAYLALPEPPDASDGAVARSMRTHRQKAREALGAVEEGHRASLREAYDADRSAWQELLLALYDTSSPITEKDRNLYARFKFADAVRVASEVRGRVRTREYAALVDDHVRAAGRLHDIVGRIKQAGAWPDKVDPPTLPVGAPLWDGPAKIEVIESDGVQVAKRFRHYRDLGIPWFLAKAVRGPDRAPRILLSADDQEALGTLAEAELVRGDVSMLEVAKEHWKAASDADPARAERLAGRVARATAEAEAHARLAEAQRLVDDVNLAIDAVDPDVTGPAKFEASGREEAKQHFSEWAARLGQAEKARQEVASRFETTVTVAVTSSRPPPRATYVGEERPPEPVAAPPAPPPDSVPSNGGPGAGDQPPPGPTGGTPPAPAGEKPEPPPGAGPRESPPAEPGTPPGS
jgi:hypothetical protein